MVWFSVYDLFIRKKQSRLRFCRWLIINIQIISERYTLCMQLKISVFIAHGGKLRGQADGYNVRTAGGQEDDGFHGRHQHAGDQRMG